MATPDATTTTQNTDTDPYCNKHTNTAPTATAVIIGGLVIVIIDTLDLIQVERTRGLAVVLPDPLLPVLQKEDLLIRARHRAVPQEVIMVQVGYMSSLMGRYLEVMSGCSPTHREKHQGGVRVECRKERREDQKDLAPHK